MAGPASLSIGLVAAATVLSAVYPESEMIYSLGLYGGILAFSLGLLVHTQEVLIVASRHSDFDPLLSSLKIYLDIVNLFVRILAILARRRR